MQFTESLCSDFQKYLNISQDKINSIHDNMYKCDGYFMQMNQNLTLNKTSIQSSIIDTESEELKLKE